MKSIEELLDLLIGESERRFLPEEVCSIKKACELSSKYATNFKIDGEEIKINPYQHSLKTAIILLKELDLGIESVIVALLMYCDDSKEIEDLVSKSTIDFIGRIRKIFGLEVNNAEMNAEYFRKLLVNISEDLRVLLICLVDRLVSMRELSRFPLELQDQFSTEVFDLFAPLAHRIGLYNIYTELCNRSFRHFHSDEYDNINKYREELLATKQSTIDNFIKSMDMLLTENGYKFHIKHRVKSPFSIWNKIENKKVSIDEIFDIFAVRVIFDPPKTQEDDEIESLNEQIKAEEVCNLNFMKDIENADFGIASSEERKKDFERRRKEVIKLVKASKKKQKEWIDSKNKLEEIKANNERGMCWKIYALIADKYVPIISRTRDWVTKPRENGYESLHTTLKIDSSTFIEVQIRSKRMDRIAEYGFAAHWQYKEKSETSSLEKWLAKIRGAVEEDSLAVGYVLDDFKPNSENNDILVFTPEKEIRRLPIGSTILDFAYEIHSQVGNKCVGGIINGKLVKEEVNGKIVKRFEGGTNVDKAYKIQNGETISIRTSKNQKPSMDWIKLVVTTKAKYNIRKSLNEAYQEQVDIGKDILKRKLKNWKYDFIENFNDIVSHFGYKFGMELYYDVATEKLNTTKIKTYLDNKSVLDTNIPTSTEIPAEASQTPFLGNKTNCVLMTVEDNKRISGVSTKCCENISCGEPVFGFFSTTGEIKIHRETCSNAADIKRKFSYRIVKLKWDKI